MRTSIKRGIAAVAVTAAALTGTAVTAQEAGARVADGPYRSSTDFLGVDFRAYVKVEGNTLLHFGPFGLQRFPIVHTPGGGYVDAWGKRYVLNQRPGGGYGGPVYLGPAIIGHITLTPAD